MRRLSLLVAGFLVLGSVIVGTALPASATTLLTCTGGTSTTNLSPGVTPTPTTQTVSGTGTLTGCSGSPGITSGTSTVHGTAPNVSCTPPASGTVTATGTETITWNNGTTSSGTFKSKATSNPVQEKVTFKITSGQFFLAGHTTKGKVTVQYTALTGSCTNSSPITQEQSSDVGNFVINQT